jgi:hypothetical protein
MEHSNKIMLLLSPHNKASLTVPLFFLLATLLLYSLPISPALQANVSSVGSVPRLYKDSELLNSLGTC